MHSTAILVSLMFFFPIRSFQGHNYVGKKIQSHILPDFLKYFKYLPFLYQLQIYQKRFLTNLHFDIVTHVLT